MPNEYYYYNMCMFEEAMKMTDNIIITKVKL